MNRLILAIAVVGTLGVAVPASAQGYGGRSAVDDLHARVAQVERQIDQQARSGRLGEFDAIHLHQQIDTARRIERQWARTDGRLDRREIAVLNTKLDQISRDAFAQADNRRDDRRDDRRDRDNDRRDGRRG